jgi:hypothetical protein
MPTMPLPTPPNRRQKRRGNPINKTKNTTKTKLDIT